MLVSFIIPHPQSETCFLAIVMGRGVCLAKEPKLSGEADTQSHTGGVGRERYPSFCWPGEGKGDWVEGQADRGRLVELAKAGAKSQAPLTPGGPGP